MRIESSIYINKDIKTVYETIYDVEGYPRFMLNVEKVKILEDTGITRLSDWSINVNETLIAWQQKDQCDAIAHEIKFSGLKGDLVNLSGLWQVTEINSSRVNLKLSVTLDLSGIIKLRYTDDFIEKKVRVILTSTLRAFKKRIDSGLEVSQGAVIISDLVNFKNRYGKNIVGYFDHQRMWTSEMPFIILPPGYGETKRDTLSTSYYLVKNGFNCIRYDATDHVGESEGSVVNTTLSKKKTDLLSTIDYVEQRFKTSFVTVVATSLANRIAIKAASEDTRIILLIGVVGVVNVQETLKAVYKEDMLEAFLKGEKWGETDVLGLKVNFENFLESAVKDDFHDLNSTAHDLSKLKIPVIFFVGEKDIWVKAEDVQFVFEKSQGKVKELHIIPEAMHQLKENPKVAQTVLKQIVTCCSKYLSAGNLSFENTIEPSIREIAMQNRIEKDRLKLKGVFALSSEKDFWAEYLTSFSIIFKVPDFREYLTLLSISLNGIKDGDQILDAGCGVGHFGAWLIYEIIRNNSAMHDIKLYSKSTYYGIDFVTSALETARNQHQKMKNEFLKERGLTSQDVQAFLPSKYQECDLNFDLPFEDCSFDKICNSLVLSYLNDPLLTAREFLRVLKPGGRIVISSLKPFADLSEVYRHFISISKNEQEIMAARKLLSEAGKIKQKEGMGHYRFFGDKDIKLILLAAGAKKIKVFRSLGNQATVAVGIK